VVRPLPGGANNRVYRIDTERGPFLGKVYFRDSRDPRDRLGAETAFLELARQRVPARVPRLLASDLGSGTALLEFIRGRKLAPGEVTWSRVAEAVSFFAGLNRDRRSPAARRLPKGSEACFSLNAHLDCVERRLDRLRALKGASPAARDAVDFIRLKLTPAWKSISRSIRSSGLAAGRIARADRCISPSDFGFHNALLKSDGRLCFIDFEYAGWDDPAKTACDFFCQPAVPVDARHLDGFVKGISRGFGRPGKLRERVRALLPAYRMKWCCILLNEFLPVGRARRKFAAKDCDPEGRKADQLGKASAALERLEW
jgi:hypothetical protein